MADIRKVIRLFKDDSGYKVFSDENFSGAEVRLRESTEAGADSGEYTGNGESSGDFGEVGEGLWSINIDSEDSGYYLVQTKTTAAPSWTNADGFTPIYIQIEPTADLDGAQTIGGVKTFSGNCEVSGNWDVSGEIDFAADTLKYGSTAYDLSLLGQSAKGTVDVEKAVVVDSSKDVDFDTGSVSATNLTATGLLLLSGDEEISDNSNLSVSKTVTRLDSSGGALANTLPDGTEGQIKVIYMEKSGNNAVVTPVNLHNTTDLTFDAVDEVAILIFLGTTWYVISSNGVTIA